jgi:ferredoxin hydrogenase large subunit
MAITGSMFTNDARVFKFDILGKLCKDAYSGDLDESNVQKWARNLVSLGTPRVRCCVYKEREVLRQRVRLAMGEMADDAAEYNPRQIIHVIDAACDGCTIKKIRVTDNCRKCMAKSCVAACRFGAMHMGVSHSEIDYDKCKECGACARACPYNAIVITERPCHAACPVDAISWDENNISVIDEAKCINCGRCENACPFGAIEDVSFVRQVIDLIRSDRETYAIVAPSIQGQFENVNLAQCMKAVEELGFTKCVEVAAGADAVADTEYKELKEHKEAGEPLTTSCCPAFVNMERIHFPEQYAKNKSSTLSPMQAIARKVKADHPGCAVVFIGPCLCKKQEAMSDEDDSPTDFAITFEELAAMFIAKGINPEDVEAETPKDQPSNYGRFFARSGGVAAAVVQAAKEHGDTTAYSVQETNGAFECRKQLTMMKFGKFNADILEGMICDGGCIAGPACISETNTVRGRMVKENLANKNQTIMNSLDTFHMDGFDIELHSKAKQ